MNYTFIVPNEPCDVVLAVRSQQLYALRFTSSSVDGIYLGETDSKDCTLMCLAHKFHRTCVHIIFERGMGLVDGVRCSKIELNEKGKEFLNEISCG